MIQSNDEPINLIAIFIFYSIASGAQACLSFSRDLKHCNVVTFDGVDWIVLDFDRSGLITKRCKVSSGSRFVELLKINQDVSAVISVQVNARTSFTWSPWWVRSCNEVCRYASGVDIGWTFNPTSLYNKLLKYDKKRNFEVLSAWRRQHGIFETTQTEPTEGQIDCDNRPTDQAKSG